MPVIAVIPARYDSSRFPGKPLAQATGKYLIQHVWEQVRRAARIDQVLVATDDERIRRACGEFGAQAVMTRRDHQSGTDRIAEVAAGIAADIVVNVQGDEPEIDPAVIDKAVELLRRDQQADLSTLCAPFGADEAIDNPNVVKVVTGLNGRALYFSRWPIPFNRDGQSAKTLYRKHLGLYAYRREALLRFARLPASPLEKTEKLEQLRALENGMTIVVGEVSHPAVGIDTPEQYAEFVKRSMM